MALAQTIFTLALLTASCLGLGAFALQAFGLGGLLSGSERSAWSWAVGYGLLGVLTFPLALAGAVQPATQVFILCLGLPGLWLLAGRWAAPNWDRADWALVLLIAAIFLLLAAHAMAPPTDADSLAYHFARPKQILADGKLTFVPMAVEGAIPLLVHLTYLPALAVGGEQAMTLWALTSGLLSLTAIVVVAGKWMRRRLGLLLLAALATTPAFLYGLGSGQVETRTVAFVFFSALALYEARRSGKAGWLLLAGGLAGCYAATKYFGLFFVAGAGMLCLFLPNRSRACFLFGLGAFATGAPVYVWNWLATGDPLFPALFQTLSLPDSDIWNLEQAKRFQQIYVNVERPAPISPGLFVSYPFLATLNGVPGWESLRTGFGPLWLLLLPFALGAVTVNFAKAFRHPLTWLLAAAFLFYGLWFYLGLSQRLRHLVPVYPILLVAIFAAADRLQNWRKPVLAAITAALLLQMAGLALYVRPALAYFLKDETRQEYLTRMVPNFEPIPWVNAQLSPSDRLLFFERQYAYYLKVPAYYGTPSYQARLFVTERSPAQADKVWTQMRNLGITHVLMLPGLKDNPDFNAFSRTAAVLAGSGCLQSLMDFKVSYRYSRTLPGLGQEETTAEILRLTPESCDPSRLRLANSPVTR